jgi:DNA polymerase-3 subunit delta'
MNGVEALPWQTAQWQALCEARRAGRVPHALLLAGRPGLGKRRFAERLGRALVCRGATDAGDACGRCPACHQAEAGTHPDLIRVAPEEEGKPIRIDRVRQVTARSVLAAEAGGFRVIVIAPAEQMNRPAANALLKTLEEPAPRTLLVLVSSHSDRLPATIRSRCRLVRFAAPARPVAHDWLVAQGLDGDPERLLALGGGAPFLALRAAAEDWPGLDDTLLDGLLVLAGRRGNPMAVVEKWREWPIDRVLGGLKRWLSDLVRVGMQVACDRGFHPDADARLQSLSQGIDLRDLFRFSDRILVAERSLPNNVNETMMLESLADRWLEITRPGGR